VADFGIARAVGVATSQAFTGPRQVIGTPAYMSPEQTEGSQYLDGRSDIYSLGCVLFEMLVGVPPFVGNTLEAVIARRLSNPVPSPRAFRELVPEAIDVAVKKALAKLPADRFVSAGQFAEALATPVTSAIAMGAATAMVQEVTTAKRWRSCRSRT
jgi:serine/threonine protein kinase